MSTVVNMLDVSPITGNFILGRRDPDKTNFQLPTEYHCFFPIKEGSKRVLGTLRFQHGPIKENGVNGITEEYLIAVLLDRLKMHQLGDFPSDNNEEAIKHIRRAWDCLIQRTQDRVDRGVEGTSKQ